MPHRVVIHWFRRDLRLTDNTALHHAAKEAEQVVPVYLLSTWKRTHHWTGAKRQQFLCGSLASLAGNLEAIGSRLILRAGDARAELKRLIQESRAEALYFNNDYDPFSRETEKQVQGLCRELGIECHGFKDRVLHDPGEVLTGDGEPYRVFTPYSRNWLAQDKPSPLPRVTHLGPPPELLSEPLPTLEHWYLASENAAILEAGERAARTRLKQFTASEGLEHYAKRRDLPAGRTTSRLSQDLRFGLTGIRELYARCQRATEAHPHAADSAQTFIKELAWREFHLAILWHHPEVLDEEFHPGWRGLPWPGSEAHFERWSAGLTGFPIVDAGMRELLQTGFMHNRVRMITAMFLTKDLHCHWRLGESFFMRHLVDGEIASNNGGWQWSAGTGADAAPYFRIQNPWTQTKTYDPAGAYIKQWLPELRDVPAALFQKPPAGGQSLARGYPAPVVDHHTERNRTLARFQAHRQR